MAFSRLRFISGLNGSLQSPPRERSIEADVAVRLGSVALGVRFRGHNEAGWSWINRRLGRFRLSKPHWVPPAQKPKPYRA
jgi:hypothetical protein